MILLTTVSRLPLTISLACLVLLDCQPQLTQEEAQLQRAIKSDVQARRRPLSRPAAKLSEQQKSYRPNNPQFIINPGGDAYEDSSTNRIVHVDLNCCRVDRQILTQLEKLPALKVLEMADSSIVDTDMEIVGQLRTLTFLDLSFTQITDKGLKHVNQVSQLRELALSWCPITNGGLRSLKNLKSLKRLWLGSCASVGDAGMAELGGLSQLEEVYLDRTQVSDNSAPILSRLVKLKVVFLDNTAISDTGLPHLARLRRLEQLHLAYCKGVTDASIPNLQQCGRLFQLDLTGTSITDACINDLAKLKSVAFLYVGDTGITAAGRAELRRSLGNGVLPFDD